MGFSINCLVCGNIALLKWIDTTKWDDPDEVRKGYDVFCVMPGFNVDSQFEFFYIECEKCSNKIVITT